MSALVLRGGRVIDPSAKNPDEVRDLLIDAVPVADEHPGVEPGAGEERHVGFENRCLIVVVDSSTVLLQMLMRGATIVESPGIGGP